MADTAGDIRSVEQLLSFIMDGGRPSYLLFWGTTRHLASVRERGA